MIIVMHWPKHIILALKLTLVVELWVLLSSVNCHCFDFGWQSCSQERPMKILTTLLWLPSCTDACILKLTLVVKLWTTVIIFCLPSGCHLLAQLEQHVTMWHVSVLIGTSHKLATYNSDMDNLEGGLSMSWWMQTESVQLYTRSE